MGVGGGRESKAHELDVPAYCHPLCHDSHSSQLHSTCPLLSQPCPFCSVPGAGCPGPASTRKGTTQRLPSYH